MADTFTKLDTHIVFAVKYRESLIDESWEIKLHKYITGIVTNKGHKMIAINGTRNHIHILMDLKPFQALSEIVREVKKSSTAFVNDMKFTRTRFQWQNGFGAFAVYRKDRKVVIDYVENQKLQHQRKSFKEEYHELLKENETEFREEHLFEWI